ncbi:response regulator receiver domain-containing protein [Dyadobacter jejuensis]|uniref:Response regulator receiver domain-containing protein n=1 Tax=Dyadobacter jejuensis TaxID=1082580 RepID=A0A316AIW2_9BACT|nr:response regulator transcription factor [Dyadobacter jejuensis]PWJ56914.1 response regulator receiver domain-containing protein [Dyadobacter jejuensis]
MITPGTTTIRVMIIDDHPLFNDGLATMLATKDSIEVVGQVYHSHSAIEAVSKARPDVAIIDYSMPGIDGLELSKMLLKEHPNLKILILSMYGEIHFIQEFREHGIKAYLVKTANIPQMLEAIQSINQGHTYFRP